MHECLTVYTQIATIFNDMANKLPHTLGQRFTQDGTAELWGVLSHAKNMRRRRSSEKNKPTTRGAKGNFRASRDRQKKNTPGRGFSLVCGNERSIYHVCTPAPTESTRGTALETRHLTCCRRPPPILYPVLSGVRVETTRSVRFERQTIFGGTTAL